MYIFVPQVWRTFYTKLKNDQLAPKLENAHLLGTVPSGYHMLSLLNASCPSQAQKRTALGHLKAPGAILH